MYTKLNYAKENVIIKLNLLSILLTRFTVLLVFTDNLLFYTGKNAIKFIKVEKIIYKNKL